ncbi:MAG TPA: bifunctional [glutamate--ammonia ligase]-adenylyl-L-tyrosine phosphorylase/[glutamate--ammonia-ligase] adenylyltransferase [Chthoniobacterales bacterium]|nr:bifunctional [glutamate--ammonia ligase]-adenylyl-L-tyrosine phosphorylase/[glutamate--ammonia-ligase] adenylyltransferase [Chthoniobacterales bacterium]
MKGCGAWATELVRSAWQPDVAERVIEDLIRVRPDFGYICSRFPDHGLALINFLCLSRISVEKITVRPDLLDWMSGSEVATSKRGHWRGWNENAADPQLAALLEWKSQEMLRIAYREVSGLAGFVETTQDITAVAERCVNQVYRFALDSLASKWGSPKTGFGILAMGKFGGKELNYSSDIDVIFLYHEDGFLNPRFSYHEFFSRLAEKIVEVFTIKGKQLFRIDLRLRPEGASGPLVRSLNSVENYYAGYGETWERMALLKGRGICGDEELLYEFEHRLQPFIFPRTVSDDILTEIAELKLRIERDLVGHEDLHRNVKLGYGGIREIEFTAQTLQLLHGARHAFLQERSTLKALAALAQLEMLDYAAVATLHKAYVFLRAVEHRLQIVDERQTHTLPTNSGEQYLIARSLGFESVEAFDQRLGELTESVRQIFRQLLQSRATEGEDTVKLDFFQRPEAAQKTLERLREGPSEVHVSARTRRLCAKLEPELISRLRKTADPDAVLSRFVRFVDAYGIRGLLFETLLANPRLLKLLVRLFDASAAFSELAIHRPELVEEIARGRSLGELQSRENFRLSLESNPANLPALTWIRDFQHAEMLRILLRDVLGFADLAQLQQEVTNLAEACVAFAQTVIPGAEDLTIIALGKFGGRELLYGADLDLVFIGDTHGPAEALIAALSVTTEWGRVFPIDTRLRPEGESSPLVVTLERYESYFHERAQNWERQALTKARVLSGSHSRAAERIIDNAWSSLRNDPQWCSNLASMYDRIVRERGKHDADLVAFKAGRGGLIAIEFIVQYLEIRSGKREPNTLDAFAAVADQLTSTDRTDLTQDYLFFRKMESVLRRVENNSVSQLPSSISDQEKIARRLGFKDRAAMIEDQRQRRERVETIFQRIVRER